MQRYLPDEGGQVFGAAEGMDHHPLPIVPHFAA
jgi:hypothetical protein